jgi:hypothetical protein
MGISVFIDSCAWNYLFENCVDLSEAFPPVEYALCITREVEIELSAIPDAGIDGTEKSDLKNYIKNSFEKFNFTTTSVFGFASLESDGSLSKVQVYGGFDQGAFQSEDDRRWYKSDEVRQLLDGKSKKKSGLCANQADASLAVRSFGSIIVTNESKLKKGPLRLATEQGGQVVYLSDVEQSKLSLKAYIASIVGGDKQEAHFP